MRCRANAASIRKTYAKTRHGVPLKEKREQIGFAEMLSFVFALGLHAPHRGDATAYMIEDQLPSDTAVFMMFAKPSILSVA